MRIDEVVAHEVAMPLVRPFRTWGYPWTTGLVLVGSVAFLIAAIVDDPRSGAFAAVLTGLAAPAAWWANRRARGSA